MGGPATITVQHSPNDAALARSAMPEAQRRRLPPAPAFAMPAAGLPAGEYVRNALSIRHPSLEHFCRSRTRPRNLAQQSPSTAASTLQLAISSCPPSRPDTCSHASSIRVFQAITLARVWGEPLLAIAMPARYAHSIHARVCLSVTRLLSYSLSVTPHPIHEVGQGDRLSLQSLVFRIRLFEILGSVGRHGTETRAAEIGQSPL